MLTQLAMGAEDDKTGINEAAGVSEVSKSRDFSQGEVQICEKRAF